MWLAVTTCAAGWFARKNAGKNTLASVLLADPGGAEISRRFKLAVRHLLEVLHDVAVVSRRRQLAQLAQLLERAAHAAAARQLF